MYPDRQTSRRGRTDRSRGGPLPFYAQWETYDLFMFLAYFDDSGENGTLILASVIVHDAAWITMHDAWFDYRRWLRQEFGLPIMRRQGHTRPMVELKGTDFANGSGPWRNLNVGRDARLRAMRTGLKVIGKHASVFAVAWVPTRPMTGSWPTRHESPLIDTWTTSLERLATYSRRNGNDRVMTIVDSGYLPQFRRTYRRMRQHHYVGSRIGGSLAAEAPMFVDDPSERDSRNSSFIQMADLAAYAALRQLHPRPDVHSLWTALNDGPPPDGKGILSAVNRYTQGQPPGIKLIPD